MQLSVKGKQLDVGDALRTHVGKSLSRILEKYFGDAIEVTVTLSREGPHFRAVITAHVGRGIQLRAQGEADEPYPAFDTAADHLAKRLRRHKRRLRDHHKEGAAQSEVLSAQQYVLDGTSAEPEAADADPEMPVPDIPVIVAEMMTEIPSLSVSAAVMRMDLADLPALLFRNSSHRGLNMIYRCSDGNVGWIDPRGNRNE
jgi:ribosomal subunit interface protein